MKERRRREAGLQTGSEEAGAATQRREEKRGVKMDGRGPAGGIKRETRQDPLTDSMWRQRKEGLSSELYSHPGEGPAEVDFGQAELEVHLGRRGLTSTQIRSEPCAGDTCNHGGTWKNGQGA